MYIKTPQTKVSFPFLSVLQLIFITLKLIGYIEWSWWWVLGPIWIPLAILSVIFIVVVFFTNILR
jgi:hypothetical protein